MAQVCGGSACRISESKVCQVGYFLFWLRCPKAQFSESLLEKKTKPYNFPWSATTSRMVCFCMTPDTVLQSSVPLGHVCRCRETQNKKVPFLDFFRCFAKKIHFFFFCKKWVVLQTVFVIFHFHRSASTKLLRLGALKLFQCLMAKKQPAFASRQK